MESRADSNGTLKASPRIIASPVPTTTSLPTAISQADAVQAAPGGSVGQRNRPRGHSTSSVRSQRVVFSAPIGAVNMARVASSPAQSRPQTAAPESHPSVAPTSSSSRLQFSLSRRSSSRGRLVSSGSGDRSRSSSRGGPGVGRSKSPPREFSFSMPSLTRKKTPRSPLPGEHTPSSVHSELTEESRDGQDSLSSFDKWRNMRSSWWQAHSPSWFDKERRREGMSPEQVHNLMKVKEVSLCCASVSIWY